MTKREAAIVSAYTGILVGEFADCHKYIEKIMDRPVLIHELGDKDISDRIKELAMDDFLNIKIEDLK
jgi:hypothetical protein